MLSSDFLTDSCLASLLTLPKATCPGNGTTYSGQAFLHQLTIKAMLTDRTTGLSDLENPSTETGDLEQGLAGFSANAGTSENN